MSKKKLVVFTLYHKQAASSQYRVFLFKNDLDRKFETVYFSFWNEKYVTRYMKNKKKYALNIVVQYLISFFKRLFQIIFIASKSDYVLFQKGVIPYSKINLMRFLKRKGIKLIFDVDDAVYLYDRGASNAIARNSDKVFAGNVNLMEHYKKYCNNVLVIPTADFTADYSDFWLDTFKNKSIGWIGQKATIDNLDLIIEPLNKLVDKHPEVTFNIICDDDYGYLNKIKNSKLIPWDEKTYKLELSKISIGIMPLKDNELNRGKCGFKLIQYMNLKKPVCASDVGVNSDIIGNGGEICSSKEDWFNQLEHLLYDKEKYLDCVKSIETEFYEKYGYEKVAQKIIFNIEY